MLGNNSIERLRKQVAEVDKKILEAISERKFYVEKIGNLKKESGLALRVPEIETQILEKNFETAKSLDLDQDFVHKLTELLIAESLKWQTKSFS